MALFETERRRRSTSTGGSPSRDWLRALEAAAPIAANPRRLLSDVIKDTAQVCRDAPALISAAERLTYGGLAARANAFARWALQQGLGKGDTVCLMMPNRPEYVAIWLGLTSVGVVVALINTQLRGSSLTHCIAVAAPSHAIVAGELGADFRAAVQPLAAPPQLWSHGEACGFHRIDSAVEQCSAAPLTPAERGTVTIEDRALLIYTSGTTGLPKAANVSHRRLLHWSFWFAGLMNTGPEDRMYDCLPLYHSIGGVVAIGAVLVRGGSVLIRDKFSVRDFWNDVVDGDCTLFQYIGELCRYLVNAPRHPLERAHRLRLCCGNGLSAEVWRQFQQRFGVPRILEFYAATEGNVSLYNVEGKVGAIGRVPPFLAHRSPLALVRSDAASGEPVRDANGFCIRCATGEAGEALGKINGDASGPGGAFEGYTDIGESQRKILRDVFARGDAWYRTGDLMRIDAGGFFYFVDRIGDTFRWKGENVATAEVAAALTAFAGVREATVYGVAIPGAEGAAGMAAIVVDGELNLPDFHRHVEARLPPYARPLFVRITDQIAATATFKPNKTGLKREGYDPAAMSDPIYFDDAASKSFVRLDELLYAGIRAGKLRL